MNSPSIPQVMCVLYYTRNTRVYHLKDHSVLLTAARPKHDSVIRSYKIHSFQHLCQLKKKVIGEDSTTHQTLGVERKQFCHCKYNIELIMNTSIN